MTRPWPFAAAVLALAVVLAGCAPARRTKHHFPRQGDMAPEITGTDQDGKQFKLSDYQGKVVLLEFWASW
jgi:cytochrome oxidase Cu insertion factor (SCO1/SenC/PrrC family)